MADTEQTEQFEQVPTPEELRTREDQIFKELGVISIQLHMMEQQREMLEERKNSLVLEQRDVVQMFNKLSEESEQETQTES